MDNGSSLFWQVEVMGSSLRQNWGNTGTIGYTQTEILSSDRASREKAEELIVEKKQKGYLETHEGYVTRYDLPRELVEALAIRRPINTSKGTFMLPAFHEIEISSVVVDTNQFNGVPFPSDDYIKQRGFYITTAYALVHACPPPYNREGLLVWLPLVEAFGTWDSTHQQLYLFAGGWRDIEPNLSNYLVAGPDSGRFTNILSLGGKLAYFDFIPWDFSARVEAILAYPVVTKRRKAEELLELYERRMLRHPLCEPLEDAYKALVLLYHRVGQTYEKEMEYARAIQWLERGVMVVSQSRHFRNQVFIDILIQLSFCYFELSRFDLSLHYLNMYQAYDASAWETCEQIKTTINNVQKLYGEAMASYQRAVEQQSAECYEEAIRITHQAVRLAPNDPLLHFNLACFYSLSYKKREALHHLEEAIKKGYKNQSRIVNDQDLKNIRSMKEFDEIRQRYF
jgi:predicted DNA-binding WGR domain protein/tetratricopeptide (TPR) repeat protein